MNTRKVPSRFLSGVIIEVAMAAQTNVDGATKLYLKKVKNFSTFVAHALVIQNTHRTTTIDAVKPVIAGIIQTYQFNSWNSTFAVAAHQSMLPWPRLGRKGSGPWIRSLHL